MSSNRVTRHGALSRLVHWSAAAAVLTLLATGFLPVLGVEFAWVAPHWIAGLVLTAVVALHIVSAIARGNVRSMGIGVRDAARVAGALGGKGDALKPGKYTLAQKLMHHAVTLAALIMIATGLLMMVRIDTPLWERNPYILSADTWGVIYVVHGFAAMAFLSLVIMHVYFSLRPEKGLYLRAMTAGWMTREEAEAHHDPALWPRNRSRAPEEPK